MRFLIPNVFLLSIEIITLRLYYLIVISSFGFTIPENVIVTLNKLVQPQSLSW